MESQMANAGGQNVAIGYATLKVADGGEKQCCYWNIYYGCSK